MSLYIARSVSYTTGSAKKSGSAFFPTVKYDFSGIGSKSIIKSYVGFCAWRDQVESYPQTLNVKMYPAQIDGKYFQKLIGESSTTNGVFTTADLNIPDTYLETVKDAGIYFDAKDTDGHPALFDVDNRPSYLLMNIIDLPSITSPKGVITKGGIYRFRWSVDRSEAIDTITFCYKIQDSASYTDISLSADANYYDFDTSSVNSDIGIQWYIKVQYRDSNKEIMTSDVETNSLSQPSVSLTDIYPTGSVYRGFSQIYRWALSYNQPSDAVGTDIGQVSAELRYRAAGATAYSTVAISGSTTNYTMAGDVLPVGSVEWQVAVTTNCGYTYTSSWTTITNTELQIAISDMYPGADGHAVKSVGNRFGWTFFIDDSAAPVKGYAKQASATLCWKNAGDTAYQTVSISGATQYHDFPAGTFTAASVTWYVVVTANTGTSATSATVTVSTVDTLSTPATISPSGVYVDDTGGVVFRWSHINATGTAQTAWEISYSIDQGTSYSVLSSASNAESSYTSASRVFAIGTVYWRVRTKNADGAWGSYSAAAIFIVRRNPDAPTILYSSADKPMPKIKWQSSSQTGYEIEVDGVSLGMIYGTTKQWSGHMILSDGAHTLRIRITDVFEDVSAWTSITLDVSNATAGSISISASELWGEVSLQYTPAGASFAEIYLLRDGSPICSVSGTDAGSMRDRETVGAHQYTVRGITADGYYTDSPAIYAAPRVPYGVIGLADGTGWIALKYTASKSYVQRAATRSGTWTHYYGRTYPDYDSDTVDSLTMSVSYLQRGIDVSALEALRGTVVVYKDFKGNLIIGVFEALSCQQSGVLDSYTITITQVHREVVTYDPV